MSAPPIYFALFHTPGPSWQSGVGFRDQEGIAAHIQYMATQVDAGRLVFGGPFLDDSGGMMVLRADDVAAALAIAAADPTVANGLLRVEVKAWMMAMSSFPEK